MRASTHALRMPNAKEVFFMGLMGLPTHPPTGKNEVKTLLCIEKMVVVHALFL